MKSDEYLDPVVARFGPHQGLNADWAVMAWRLADFPGGSVWLLDDESGDETVSVVTRSKDEGSVVVSVCTGNAMDVPAAIEFIEILGLFPKP